ncbi:hypothetical protein [Streptomyces sp. Ac-502]|uniref:hypothetical protein n=1 Tax=Streptomyces sp. Ac-502 TaxID=3342801 RepID=UPI00386259C5
MLNAGIGGNLLLDDAPWFGERAGARFRRDVLDKPGVRTVIVLAGLDDIGFSEVDKTGFPTYRPNPDLSAAQLIEGYRDLIATALADPTNPLALLPAYDSGDRKHLGDAEYRAMAEVVDAACL